MVGDKVKTSDIIDVEINGTLTKCEVISIIERNDEQFVIYSTKDKETSNLYVSKLLENNGKFTLEDTDDKEVHDYVLKLISRKVKSISKANNSSLKEGLEKSPKRDDVITASSFGNTKVTENNIDSAIDIMKEWSEENK